MNKSFKPDYKALLLTATYFAINLIVLLHHEAWLDEAQSWLLARDCSIPELFEMLKYEGHPFLYYLILMPFAKLGFPYITANLISLFFMTASVYLLARYYDGSYIVKISLLFSSLFMYFYPVFARSYALIIFFAVLLIVNYPKINDKPIKYGIIIALLFTTHVLSFGLGLVMTVILFLNCSNKKQAFKGVAVALTGFVLASLSVMGSTSTNINTVNDSFEIFDLGLYEIYLRIINYVSAVFEQYVSVVLPFNILQLAFIGAFVLSVLFTVLYPKQGLILLGCIGFQFAVHLVIYPLYMINKLMVMLVGVMVALMTVCYEKPTNLFSVKFKQKYMNTVVSTVIIILFVVSFGNLQDGVKFDVEYKYSSSQDIAEYINSELPSDSVLVINSFSASTAIAAYLESARLYNPMKNEFFTYSTWDGGALNPVDVELYKKNIEDNLSGHGNIYLLCWEAGLVENIEEFLKGKQQVTVFFEQTISNEPKMTIYKYNNSSN